MAVVSKECKGQGRLLFQVKCFFTDTLRHGIEHTLFVQRNALTSCAYKRLEPSPHRFQQQPALPKDALICSCQTSMPFPKIGRNPRVATGIKVMENLKSGWGCLFANATGRLSDQSQILFKAWMV